MRLTIQQHLLLGSLLLLDSLLGLNLIDSNAILIVPEACIEGELVCVIDLAALGMLVQDLVFRTSE